MDQKNVLVGTNLRQAGWTKAINAHCLVRFGLGTVDGRIGGRIDDDRRLVFPYQAADLSGMLQISLAVIKKTGLPTPGTMGVQVFELLAQLSTGSQDHDDGIWFIGAGQKKGDFGLSQII